MPKLPLFDEPPAWLTDWCNSTTSAGHLLMAIMAFWFASHRCRRVDVAMAGIALIGGSLMHFLGGLADLADARWVMIVRTFCGPFILWGWYRVLRAIAAADRKLTRTEAVIQAATSGPNTQRLIDARVLLEQIDVPTPMTRRKT